MEPSPEETAGSNDARSDEGALLLWGLIRADPQGVQRRHRCGRDPLPTRGLAASDPDRMARHVRWQSRTGNRLFVGGAED